MEISKLHASRIPLPYLNKLTKNFKFTRQPGNLFLNSMNMLEKFKLKQEIPNLELRQRLYDRFNHFLPFIEYITSHSDSAVYLVVLGRSTWLSNTPRKQVKNFKQAILETRQALHILKQTKRIIL